MLTGKLGRALVGAWVGMCIGRFMGWCMVHGCMGGCMGGGDVGDVLGGGGVIGSTPHPIFIVKLPRISFFTPLKLCSEMPV